MRIGRIQNNYTAAGFDLVKNTNLEFIEICCNDQGAAEKLIANKENIKAEIARTGIDVSCVGRWNHDINVAGKIDEEKLNEFAGAEIMITDRLHAMVFAAISGTACVVMKNNNHKITGTYDWIRDLPHIQFADDVQQAAELAAKLRSAQQHDYDHTALSGQFDSLRSVIQEATLTKKG